MSKREGKWDFDPRTDDRVSRVGRLFFDDKLDTRDIGIRLEIPESTVVRDLAAFKARRG